MSVCVFLCFCVCAYDRKKLEANSIMAKRLDVPSIFSNTLANAEYGTNEPDQNKERSWF